MFDILWQLYETVNVVQNEKYSILLSIFAIFYSKISEDCTLHDLIMEFNFLDKVLLFYRVSNSTRFRLSSQYLHYVQ